MVKERDLNPRVRHWVELGKKRTLRILGNHTVSCVRTLEQKISDAGPNDQRVEPVHLTTARNELLAEGSITFVYRMIPWYFIPHTDPNILVPRLNELVQIHDQTTGRNFTDRMGQALEIAVYGAILEQDELLCLGGAFTDLQKHDDRTRYIKQDHSDLFHNRRLDGQKLDFLLLDGKDLVGVEVKNTREWVYADQELIRELLFKCCQLDAVPVLIARRISYVAFTELFKPCGIIAHQVYNQRYPFADAELARKASDKNLLGFHDIVVGNIPDQKLLKFFKDTLPKMLPDAKQKFKENKVLLQQFANRKISYADFRARLHG